MRAIVYKGPNEVSVENVPDLRIGSPTDAIVRITSAGICGSDLHMYEGRTPGPPRSTSSTGSPNGWRRPKRSARSRSTTRAASRASRSGRSGPATSAYEKFDSRTDGYTKVVLKPAGAEAA